MQALNVFSRKRTQQETFSEELRSATKLRKNRCKKTLITKVSHRMMIVCIYMYGSMDSVDFLWVLPWMGKENSTPLFYGSVMWESPSSLMFLKQIGPRTGYYDLDGPSAFCTGGWGFIDAGQGWVQPPTHGRCQSNVTQPAVATWPL